MYNGKIHFRKKKLCVLRLILVNSMQQWWASHNTKNTIACLILTIVKKIKIVIFQSASDETCYLIHTTKVRFWWCKISDILFSYFNDIAIIMPLKVCKSISCVFPFRVFYEPLWWLKKIVVLVNYQLVWITLFIKSTIMRVLSNNSNI